MRDDPRVLVPSGGRAGAGRLGLRNDRRLQRIASGLAFRMEYAQTPEDLLAGAAELIARELRLPYVHLEVTDSWGDLAATTYGTRSEPTLRAPLTYQGYPAGEIVVSGRRPGQPVTERDRRVLLEVARHAGAVLHTGRLLRDLRQSLDAALYARDEERRRLRHELHDSLGPIMAGISLGLHAAQRLMIRDPDQAEQLVNHLEQELQSAIIEVRRLFETLRPPALDQLGLVPAVQEHIKILATRMSSGDDSAAPVSFALNEAGDFAALPAIVEVAAYRIVCEALTNVARHSQARTCTVNLSRDSKVPSAVQVEVLDDGVGFIGRRGHGVGLGSMRERARELGGTFEIDTPPAGGTRVVATLPVHPAPAAANR
jgi:signal transduction histidine kinase